MNERLVKMMLSALGTTTLLAGLSKLKSRLELSAAKHPSLTGHARMARRVASLVPFYEFGEEQFFRFDQVPDEIVARRRDGFMRLAQLYRERFAETRRLTEEAQESISDLRFTDRCRVPFQYSRMIREHLRTGSFLNSADGVMLTDLDGNRFYDLAGSYGVNVFGYDFYKSCMEEGWQRVRKLGSVLGDRCSVRTIRWWPKMLSS